jgi:hypothetical protein
LGPSRTTIAWDPACHLQRLEPTGRPSASSAALTATGSANVTRESFILAIEYSEVVVSSIEHITGHATPYISDVTFFKVIGILPIVCQSTSRTVRGGLGR